RAFYSLNHGPDKIVFLNGAYILRQPQAEVRLPGCRPIYGRQMDEMMIPFREMRINISEFAAFKAASFFNPDAMDLTPCNKQLVAEERLKYLTSLFNMIVAQQ
uniref:NR LBD domain-containing protein n=1 Tax=Plectus sambesii TaxID=2011161 RepID=A0A914VG31_9BILA